VKLSTSGKAHGPIITLRETRYGPVTHSGPFDPSFHVARHQRSDFSHMSFPFIAMLQRTLRNQQHSIFSRRNLKKRPLVRLSHECCYSLITYLLDSGGKIQNIININSVSADLSIIS
jgi:hypothetical protein